MLTILPPMSSTVVWHMSGGQCLLNEKTDPGLKFVPMILGTLEKWTSQPIHGQQTSDHSSQTLLDTYAQRLESGVKSGLR